MRLNKKNNKLSWLLLILIGTSISFTTLHSHHHLKWDHVKSHADTGHCLVENSNLCPIDGYLFGAQTVEPQSHSTIITWVGYVVTISDGVHYTAPTGRPTDRAPPYFG